MTFYCVHCEEKYEVIPEVCRCERTRKQTKFYNGKQMILMRLRNEYKRFKNYCKEQNGGYPDCNKCPICKINQREFAKTLRGLYE